MVDFEWVHLGNLRGRHRAEVGGEVVLAEKEYTLDRGIPVVSGSVDCLTMSG